MIEKQSLAGDPGAYTGLHVMAGIEWTIAKFQPSYLYVIFFNFVSNLSDTVLKVLLDNNHVIYSQAINIFRGNYTTTTNHIVLN